MTNSGNPSYKYNRLSIADAAVLLVDHQAGLLSLVRDIESSKFKNSVLALGKCAKYFGLPSVMTTSFEQGPNGPMMPELKEMLPDAAYIARPGEISATNEMLPNVRKYERPARRFE